MKQNDMHIFQYKSVVILRNWELKLMH